MWTTWGSPKPRSGSCSEGETEADPLRKIHIRSSEGHGRPAASPQETARQTPSAIPNPTTTHPTLLNLSRSPMGVSHPDERGVSCRSLMT